MQHLFDIWNFISFFVIYHTKFFYSINILKTNCSLSLLFFNNYIVNSTIFIFLCILLLLHAFNGTKYFFLVQLFYS